MSTATKQRLQIAGVIVAMLSGASGFIGAFYLLPYRVSAAEGEIREIKKERATDHDLLQRIDERTARMEKALERLTD